MTKLQEQLFSLSDKQYALFQAKLTPTISSDLFIGVRVPVLKKFAIDFIKDKESKNFIHELPHKYYDENMLHSILLTKNKDYEESIKLVNEFLPYVDNWAVCDTLKPISFKKNKDKLIKQIKIWINDDKTYTIRFGIEMLMNFYLDDDFKIEYLKLANVKSEEYYVKMMSAWYYATALAKHYDDTINYLLNTKMDDWTFNKTIQKAIESYRIDDSQKTYLKSLKRK